MQYTTGELAKLCGVSVRTVQYYDERGILVPCELSEGGRRLYGDASVRRLSSICYLRELGVSISAIGELLADGCEGDSIAVLLDRQREQTLGELAECKKRLEKIEDARRDLRVRGPLSLDSMGDLALVARSRERLRHLRAGALLAGLPLNLLQCLSIALWIACGLWWPFLLWCGLAAVWGTWFSLYYFTRVVYICPICHTVFKPRFCEAFFAKHTPTLRRLTCTCCGKKSLCLEAFREERKEKHGKNS